MLLTRFSTVVIGWLLLHRTPSPEGFDKVGFKFNLAPSEGWEALSLLRVIVFLIRPDWARQSERSDRRLGVDLPALALTLVRFPKTYLLNYWEQRRRNISTQAVRNLNIYEVNVHPNTASLDTSFVLFFSVSKASKERSTYSVRSRQRKNKKGRKNPLPYHFFFYERNGFFQSIQATGHVIF